MNKELARYLILHFPRSLTDLEYQAIKHAQAVEKIGNAGPDSGMAIFYKTRGLTDDPAVQDLLKDGYDAFELNVANRIIAECSEKVFLNKCPKCGKLARTPYARQCRFCHHDWHKINVAKFKLNNSFQLTGKHFFLLGNIVEGALNIGDFMDLTMLGLGCRPKIEAINFPDKGFTTTFKSFVALGTYDLKPDEKEYLKNTGSFGTPFDIISDIKAI